MNTNTLVSFANENGLIFRGGFSVTPEDDVPSQIGGQLSESLLLFGQAGNSLWPTFSQSAELADRQSHPLDRWSERVGQSIAEKVNGRLLLPFGDTPHHPFLRWASRIEDVQPSRLGMLIHPIHGLWHAYRFAIALGEPVEDLSTIETRGNICNQCQIQPCLKQCPVGAFDGTRYDVKVCYEYLQGNPESACHTSGCQARDACPEGEHSHYATAQKQFHMKQFTQALHNRLGKGANS
jgi:hypothetical protein